MALAFDVIYLVIGTFLMLVNRILYSVIARRALLGGDYKKLIMFLFIFFIPILIIFPQLKSSLNELTYPILVIGILSAIMCTFSCVNYFNKMTASNKNYILAMFLFVIADVLMVYNQFIMYKIYFVIIYTSIYYLARYLVCKAMIVYKN